MNNRDKIRKIVKDIPEHHCDHYGLLPTYKYVSDDHNIDLMIAGKIYDIYSETKDKFAVINETDNVTLIAKNKFDEVSIDSIPQMKFKQGDFINYGVYSNLRVAGYDEKHYFLQDSNNEIRKFYIDLVEKHGRYIFREDKELENGND